MLQVELLDDLGLALNQSIERAFSDYWFSSQSFFGYLEAFSSKGLNRKQFEIYRDNYFFRTASTPESIFRLVKAAALCSDFATFQTASENLKDELGRGSPNYSHLQLLETAYNVHGKTVFALEEITIAKIESSALICPEAVQFRTTQKSLYESSSYLTVLGCSFAQELAANEMLEVFYKTLFKPYQHCYPRQKFQRISRYFTAHINGLEAAHAEQARQALVRNCRSLSDLALMIEGVNGFLQVQAALWNGILREMQRAGEVLPP